MLIRPTRLVVAHAAAISLFLPRLVVCLHDSRLVWCSQSIRPSARPPNKQTDRRTELPTNLTLNLSAAATAGSRAEQAGWLANLMAMARPRQFRRKP